MAKTPPLPKRFQPLLNQALTEAALRYGSQESGLASLLGQLTHNYQQQSQAQNTAGQSLLGSLKGADQRLQGVYSDAGLTPTLLAGIANSPTGQRLAGELAQGRGDLQSQMLGAQAGQQYIQGHLADQYHQDLGQLSDQAQAEQKERGLFTQSTLGTLISGDRAARHDANVAAAKQAHDDFNAELQRQTSTGNALIGQGLQPILGADGSVSVGAPLPGGKADPAAQKKPKRTSGPGTASKTAQTTAGTQFSGALANATKGLRGKAHDSQAVQQAVDSLVAGRPASHGGVTYDTVDVKDAYGNVTGTKQVPRLDSTGQRVTSPSSPAVPGVPRPVAQAAVEQAAYGYVTTATVQALQKLGYSVRQIPGLITQTQHQATTPASPTTQRTRPNKSGNIRDIYG